MASAPPTVKLCIAPAPAQPAMAAVKKSGHERNLGPQEWAGNWDRLAPDACKRLAHRALRGTQARNAQTYTS